MARPTQHTVRRKAMLQGCFKKKLFALLQMLMILNEDFLFLVQNPEFWLHFGSREYMYWCVGPLKLHDKPSIQN